VPLLKKIVAEKLVSSEEREDLLSKTKEVLLLNIDWLDEYRPLLRFSQNFPDVLSAEEKSGIAQAFPALARRNILDELSEDDPVTLRSYAYEIEDIARDLNVDVAELLKDIEFRACDREEDAEQPDDFGGNRPKQDNEWCDDTEIESIFAALR
jgi:hypothetical protein